jgi:hypothetical protein
MSSSSDEGETFQLRNHDLDDTDDERPQKRRKTAGRPLWSKGVGFVSSSSATQDTIEGQQEDAEDSDVDDERPTMGSMGGFRGAFNLGEYSEEMQRDPSPPPSMNQQPQKPIGTSRSAFGPGGNLNKNSFAARMMAKQGYVEGQGLGRHGQGISAPIESKVLQSRAGLGAGSGTPEPPRKDKKPKDRSSKPSTSGTSTPRTKAPPKTKYTVAAIESRGLHVPDSLKSVIIDATGTENKTISSLSASGFSTPTRELSPAAREKSKIAARYKLQLSAYAESWDSAKAEEKWLNDEEAQLRATVDLYREEEQRISDLIITFERVTADDSAQARTWEEVITRLQAIQSTYKSSVEELGLSPLAISALKPAFRTALAEWDPFANPSHVASSLESLPQLLQLQKLGSTHPRKRSTPFESLLLQHWYPYIRSTFQHEWSIYDPEPATNLLTAWTPLLPVWLQRKFLSELIMPRLIDGVRRFPRRVDPNAAPGVSTPPTQRNRKTNAPDLHAWLFDWWTLLSSQDLNLELFPELRSLVKSKISADVWPLWKPLLGSTAATKPQAAKPAPVSVTAQAPDEEPSFRDIVETWAAEHDLLLRSTGTADSLGRLLYRLVDVGGKGKGLKVYLLDDVVYDATGDPWDLDDELVGMARTGN